MKKLKGFSLILVFIYTSAFSQIKFSGYIYDAATDIGLNNVSVFNPETNEISYSDKDGYYEIIINNYDSEISFYLEGYNLYNKVFASSENNKASSYILFIKESSSFSFVFSKKTYSTILDLSIA